MLAAEFEVITAHITTKRLTANVEDTNGKSSLIFEVNSIFFSYSTICAAWHTLSPFAGYSLPVQWTCLLAVLVLLLLYSTLTFITHNLFSFCAAISSETKKKHKYTKRGGGARLWVYQKVKMLREWVSEWAGTTSEEAAKGCRICRN